MVLYLEDERAMRRMDERIAVTEAYMKLLSDRFGEENVRITMK